MPTPPANAKSTTFQVGTYTALTDTFTLSVDLNDGATWWISNGSLKLDQPDKVDNRSFNLRTSGERVVKTQYKNRHIQVSVNLRGASTAAMMTSLRTLIGAIEHPDTNPYCLRLALPGATLYTYADVVRIKHNIPSDPLALLALAVPKVQIDFECRPFLRGDRVTLSNLIANPGFEAPFGGGLATEAPAAFADSFANVNAYTSLGGSAPTTGPVNTYVDIVLANGGANLLRYYRLDESSGTSAYDIAGTGQTGTTHGSPTQGVAGGISGDTDTAYTLASASSQYVTLPSTGLPSGNGAMSLGCLFKISANPGVNATLLSVGTAGTAHDSLNLYVNTSGKLCADGGSGTTVLSSASTVTNGAWHLGVVTWDGTTMSLYLDNAVAVTSTPGAQTIPASPYATIGGLTANGTGWTNFWNGSVDEVCAWNAALSSTQVGNLYTAMHSGATGTLANAMSVPSGATAGFGSPAWGAVQTWQVRFRWSSAANEFDFLLHRTDANNALFVAVKPTQMLIGQTVAGVFNLVASNPIFFSMTNGGYYWLQVTQFPAPSGVTPYVQATLYYDANGTPGSQVAQAAGVAYNATTALVGAPAMIANGAALVLGGQGNSGGLGQTVWLFGPGGWLGLPAGGASVASLAWDGSAAGAPTSLNTPGTNTATLGLTNSGNGGNVQVPVTSFGSARVDAPPTGAWNGAWQFGTTTSLTALQQLSVPVNSGGDVLAFTGALRATGNGTGYSAFVTVVEYNAAGTQVASTTHALASGNGSLATWAAWAWTLTTQATTAYAVVQVGASDSTSSSAGSTTWFDNVACWDQTALATAWGCSPQSSMPYCELRFPNSPAQLVVSGLLGDGPAPAAVALGTYEASLPAGSTLSLALGRRGASVGARAQLCGPAFSSSQPNRLDATSYGGYIIVRAASQVQEHDLYVAAVGDSQGFYEVVTRAQTAQTSGNLGNLSVRVTGAQGSAPLGAATALAVYYSLYAAKPFAASNTWTLVNTGPLWLPIFPVGALTDVTQHQLTVDVQYTDATSGGAAAECNWLLLLPADGSLVQGSLINPSNASGAITASWIWVYADQLAMQLGQSPSMWSYGTTGAALPSPNTGAGGPGTSVSGYPNVNPSGDVGLTLDPQMSVSGAGNGINQLAGYIADQNGAVLPLFAEIAYTPLYLYPR